MPPLRIGISSCFFHPDPARPLFKGKTLLYLEQSLAQWIIDGGALAYLIPAVPQSALQDLVSDLDGILLQGGSDVAPESYGEKPLRPEWCGDRIRDQYEIEIVKTALTQAKPLLGICRGAQLLNVALGGTLYQDIVEQVRGAEVHRNWEDYDRHSHTIRFDENGSLARLFGTSPVKVNSIHHQAIKDLAPGLQTEAFSTSDNIIEAVRLKGPQFALALQWHPEFHPAGDSSWLNGDPIRQEFLNAAQMRRAKK